ncbi:DUF924 family protein [Labrys sp. LIt4]|uniref:DUF924 domain-containing protein n=1 Tax=Labrys okinawensis TaxID=346911 RepID=A0A2S9Q9R8_9HYPH|nr:MULTISPECIES: DUF924 family protein [Labrys]MBP0581655.1 DUF924 family protein [Labrys sp. LIt4]PRH86060.1 DUF924 domain-containing protein [Labrys okinawensis]
MVESVPPSARALVDFWVDAGPERWFEKDEAFDRDFRERFLPLHQAAMRGELDGWGATAPGALALVLLLDQFPRNAFRDTPAMYAGDPLARRAAAAALAAGHDRSIDPQLRIFFYLPFMHSEELADQERSLALCRTLEGDYLRYAREHRDIVARFGRFPHRNAILGRICTPEEQRFLDDGGFAG